MSKIDQFVARFRKIATTNSSINKKRSSPVSGTIALREGTQTVLSQEPLQRHFAQQVKEIDCETEAGRKLALEIFLRTVLTEQYGVEILNDPEFSELSKAVEQTFISDSRIYQKFLFLLRDVTTGKN